MVETTRRYIIFSGNRTKPPKYKRPIRILVQVLIREFSYMIKFPAKMGVTSAAV
jgi:hypothetical protein